MSIFAQTQHHSSPGFSAVLRLKWVTILAVVGLSVVLGSAAAVPSLARAALGLTLAAFALAVGFYRPRTLVVGLIFWLAALGLIRRLADVVLVSTADFDTGP